ncbi:hypothetical protein AB434_0313 [Heyndrickxia coagulans]|uniref:Uncharacterized protein n=1 Tax=Heyndrickxia coagulans TaxID=1398 RepID=A0AAN0WB62_HEYCO|nr:hypothetical protein SB48_HM08orf01350 [Heyndrickxia coagulans]AKN52718.1 hypothetical protein AB434_0313 [Heyndrickxia coagulans]
MPAPAGLRLCDLFEKQLRNLRSVKVLQAGVGLHSFESSL